MKISRNGAALGAIAVLLASAGIPALGQDSPESLLPPGFDEPVPTTAPQPAPQPSARPAQAPPSGVGFMPLTDASPTPSPTPTATPTPLSAAELAKYELPASARRSLYRIGAIDSAGDSIAPAAFGNADGRFLETLMRRTEAPIASRWLSIALRRALLSEVDTPANVNGADFAAERAWLLLRMGEANAARDVVQAVDVQDYTPKLFQVAMQASLAAADPAGLCPMVEGAQRLSRDRGWAMARAMCAGLAGEPGKAGPLIDAVRRRGTGDQIDVLLAEKVLGTGAQGRRAVTIEWEGTDALSAWRYGLAVASAVDVPERLIAGAGPQVRYWHALAPMVGPRARAAAAELAGAQGVFSSQGLVDLYGEIEETEESSTAEVAVARDLRTAYVAASYVDRVAAMKTLWDEPKSARGRYGRLVLTARAAARIVPDAAYQEEGARLIASMLTAGRDLAAVRWREAMGRGNDGWAMIALADPAQRRVLYGDVDAYRNAADTRKAQMLFAGLAGLGRLDANDINRLAEGLDVRVGADNGWTRAIDIAATRNQPGTVLLLAAVAMQTRSWQGVPPEAVFHITAALRRTGMEGYARMIAAEAIARL